MKNLREISEKELEGIIKKHEYWLNGDYCNGEPGVITDCIVPNLATFDCQNSLRDFHFENVIFDNVLFDETDMFFAKFLNVEFRNCTFKDVAAIGTLFRDCKFNFTNLESNQLANAIFQSCHFRYCVLSKSEMSSANSTGILTNDYHRCSFYECNMIGVLFQNAKFTNSNIENCVLNSSDFSFSQFLKCDFRWNSLEMANFESVDFFKTRLFWHGFLDFVKTKGIVIKKCILRAPISALAELRDNDILLYDNGYGYMDENFDPILFEKFIDSRVFELIDSLNDLGLDDNGSKEILMQTLEVLEKR